MAFGLSGANDTSTMDDADVVVAHYSNNEAKADDYDLNARAQVSSQGTRVKTINHLSDTSGKKNS